MINLSKRKLFLTIFLISFIALISAYFIEYVLGYQPCNLCLYERVPYFLAILILLVNFSKYEAKVAPKWTNGPYWPTEAPPLAEINAVKVEPIPFLISIEFLDWCEAKIESGGPWNLSILNNWIYYNFDFLGTTSR